MMKRFFTLWTVLLPVLLFSQALTITETFPSYRFNNDGLGGQSGHYTGNMSGWYFTASAGSIIEVDNSPGEGNTHALRFAAGNCPTMMGMAVSPEICPASGSAGLRLQFDWYATPGADNNYEVAIGFSHDDGHTWSTAWSIKNAAGSNEWKTVTVAAGLERYNALHGNTGFRFRITTTSAGPPAGDIWIDNIRITAPSSGAEAAAVPALPGLVSAGGSNALFKQPGKTYEIKNSRSLNNPDPLAKRSITLQMANGTEETMNSYCMER